MVHLREDWTNRHGPHSGCTTYVCRSRHWANVGGPFSSSHSLLECRQHAVRPDARVRPVRDGRGLSGGSSQERHCHRFVVSFPACRHFASIFLHPLTPPALPGFFANMGALTSERRLFVHESPTKASGHAGVTAHEHRPSRSALLASCDRTFGPFRLQSSDVVKRDKSGLIPLPYRIVSRTIAVSPRPRRVIWASPFPSRLATTPDRIEFVMILRTSRSPPVALHLASRRRSYVQLQGSDSTLTRTCTSLVRSTYKRTRTGPSGLQNKASVQENPKKPDVTVH
jgi:hypothetical protein